MARVLFPPVGTIYRHRLTGRLYRCVGGAMGDLILMPIIEGFLEPAGAMSRPGWYVRLLYKVVESATVFYGRVLSER